LGVLFLCL